MDIHAGAEHDFAGDVGRFGHLNHLPKHQLFDNLRGYFAACQHLPHHHFPQIDSRYSVKCRRLTCKRSTQSTDNGNAITLTGDER
ncbi:hypothetical protein D3C85_1807980 [compost metagenome]